MKKQKFKRILACFLITAIMVGTMTGCGNKKENKEDTSIDIDSQVQPTQGVSSSEDQNELEGFTYPLKEEVVLTIGMCEEPRVSAKYKNWLDTPFAQEWQKATGVKLEMEFYPDENALNLMIASGELPDIIWLNLNSYNGGPARAIKDKVIEPINDYMQYAPDLQAAFDSNDVWKKSCITADGDIIGFPFIRGDAELLTSAGMIIRTDFLEAVGEELPETTDDFYRVLKKFKEELNVEAPFSLASWYFTEVGLGHGLLTSGFNLPKTYFYVKDGEVHYGFYEKEYKDVLAFLKKLYDEGLLDKNFATVDPATQQANFMNGVSGATIDTLGSGLNKYITTMKDDPNFGAAGFGPLVGKAGERPMSTHYDNAVTGMYAVITPQCKNKEIAAWFLNYGYTEAGSLLMNYGIEGDNYTLEDGKLVFTNKYEGIVDGTVGHNRAWASFPFIQSAGSKTYTEEVAAALARWTNSDAEKYQYPPVSIPADKSGEYSKINADLWTYTFEMTIKFITGLEDLDNFESKYLKEMEDIGVKTMIEIAQSAYDEFESR